MRANIIALCTCLVAGLSAAVDPWPAQTTAVAAAAPGQLLAALDPAMRLEMSGAHWNPVTRTLWVTAAGEHGAGTWALDYDDGAGGSFRVRGFWSHPRDEDLTQAAFEPVTPGRHRFFFLQESRAQILQALLIEQAAGNGTAQTERIWSIPELTVRGDTGAEGLAFVPDTWLAANGFVDGAGQPCVSEGGLGGLMFVAHQDGGHLYAIDLSADGSARFADRSYRIVGVYRTGFAESSALCFDRSIGRLYISHNSNGNRIEVTDLTSIPVAGDAKAGRQLRALAVTASPQLINPEGFACTPFLDEHGAINTQRWAFFANDCESGDPLADREKAVVWYRDFRPETGVGRSLVPAHAQAWAGTVGSALPIAPAVQVRDSRGYPLAGVPVGFAPGTGTVVRMADTTDARGEASCGTWTLGRNVGRQILTATSAGAADLVLTALAQAGPASTLHKVAGDGQDAAPGAILAVAPRVHVCDAFDNPLDGVAVRFAVVAGGGRVAHAEVTTGADGDAGSGDWTLGPQAGSHVLSASAVDLPPVLFTATAHAADGTGAGGDAGGGRCGLGAMVSLSGVPLLVVQVCLRRSRRRASRRSTGVAYG